MREKAAPPDWFVRALAVPRESRIVEVDGCPIHYLRWGDPARPGLLLIPASGGHAHWYDHVAPLLADQFHVVAIDLAGTGDSGRRQEYGQASSAAEIMAVCNDSGMLTAEIPPTVIGHSAGAQIAVRLAMARGDALLGVVTVDGLRYAELEKDHAIAILRGPRPAPRPPRIHADFEDAVARFRFMPTPLAPVEHDFIVDHIARHSYRPVEGGWTSKYDPVQGSQTTLGFELADALQHLACQAAVLYGEHSHIAEEDAADVVSTLNGGKVTVFTIPGTTHFLPIDSPFAFVAAIKGIVLTWIAARRRT